MGQILDFNAASNILKPRFESKPVETALIKEHPAVADMPKDPTKGGASWNIAVKYAVMSTRATTVPNALANGGPDQYGRFTITNGLYNDYAVMLLSNIARDEAMDGGDNAMVKLAEETLMGGYQAAYESLANAMFGNGGGARAQVASSSFAQTTLTLTNTQDALKFRPNMVVQASSDDGTGGAGVRTGTVTLAGVDPINGILTATANWSSGISAIAQNDYLFMYGDYDSVFVGLNGWIVAPGTSITSTPFFGQDRTKNTLLAGWNFAGGGANYEDTITQLCAMVCQYDGKPDRIYVNPLDFGQLCKQQSAKVRYDRTTKSFNDPSIEFSSLEFVHPKGVAQIVADAYCPIGHFYVITLNSWKLYSNGKICRPANNWVGDMWLQYFNDDYAQARIVTRAFLGSTAPWQNGHGTF